MSTQTHTNWREEYSVNVGWAGRPELGTLPCDAVEVWRDAPGAYREPHPARTARFAMGKVNRVAWNHSEERYVWL